MTSLNHSFRHSRKFAELTLVLVFVGLCFVTVVAQTVDRAQLLSEILSLQNQLKAATDPVQIAALDGQLKIKEAAFLQPDATDFTTNATFLAQPETGLVRLLPRETFDGVLQTRGGGAYYSFVRLVHEYGYGSDVSLEQGRFSVGFAGADFGFLVSLGATDLTSVSADHSGVKYLAAFTSPLSEPEARLQQQRAGQGFNENGFFYRSSLPTTLGESFALRSVGYDDSDVLVAFRFVREDTDNSRILQWKLLRRFSTPHLNGGSLAGVSAASYKRGVFARNSIVALFGNNLSSTTEVASTTPLPFSLAGVRVSYFPANSGGRNVQLFAVTPGQANFLIPADARNGWGSISVSRADGSRLSELIRIAPVAPGLFTANADGQGVPAAVVLRVNGSQQTYEPVARFDGGQNKFVAAPIDLGAATDQVFLLLFGTGWRERSSLINVSVKIGGVDAPVGYAGEQGGVGLDQLNVALPRSLAGRGDVDVVLTVDGQIANTVR
ncbi:MAG TPA: hypothetical protein PLQ88_20305, partial [Blastocatellia bacterium]|nr:hypothetical protein [Blastocatellia bacterium]